jgi:hypothetical protein
MRPADSAVKDGAAEGGQEDGEHGGLEQCSLFIITYLYISITSFHQSQFSVRLNDFAIKGSCQFSVVRSSSRIVSRGNEYWSVALCVKRI